MGCTRPEQSQALPLGLVRHAPNHRNPTLCLRQGWATPTPPTWSDSRPSSPRGMKSLDINAPGHPTEPGPPSSVTCCTGGGGSGTPRSAAIQPELGPNGGRNYTKRAWVFPASLGSGTCVPGGSPDDPRPSPVGLGVARKGLGASMPGPAVPREEQGSAGKQSPGGCKGRRSSGTKAGPSVSHRSAPRILRGSGQVSATTTGARGSTNPGAPGPTRPGGWPEPQKARRINGHAPPARALRFDFSIVPRFPASALPVVGVPVQYRRSGRHDGPAG
jgi:hypothetical protein